MRGSSSAFHFQATHLLLFLFWFLFAGTPPTLVPVPIESRLAAGSYITVIAPGADFICFTTNGALPDCGEGFCSVPANKRSSNTTYVMVTATSVKIAVLGCQYDLTGLWGVGTTVTQADYSLSLSMSLLLQLLFADLFS
jgi:hypothetical protein